jgi:hypothetical protein
MMFVSAEGLGGIRIDRGVQNRARRIRRTGFARKGKSLAFCAMQDGKSAESFARSIALRSPCFAQAQGIRPWTPVERMRSTQGRIHGGPGNAYPSGRYGRALPS